MDHSEVKNLPKIDHTPAELDEASRIILKAADLIDKHGLSKGCLSDRNGAMCINGAVLKAMFGKPDWYDSGVFEKFLASDARSRLVRHFGGEPADFNNAPERTKDDVVAKLRAVALGG